MEQPEPRKEHQWLKRLAGEWTFEIEAAMSTGGEPERHTGTESVRSLGGVWVLLEGRDGGAEGGESVSLMTLGYDPAKEAFVGTFVSSMMTYLWIYDGGTLDGDVLTLDAEGPSFTTEGEMARYRDTIELRGDDHRVLSSSYQNADGTWQHFMTSHYRRVK